MPLVIPPPPEGNLAPPHFGIGSQSESVRCPTYGNGMTTGGNVPPSDQTVPAASTRRPWQRFKPDEEAAAMQMYADGKTVREIAEWFDRPTASVYLMLRRNGADFRPRGAAAKPVPAAE